ncbi:hypothetical protein TCAL_17011 [Tigriopus californicus]|uniref:Chitin-binding type-2 domain-containing protein n=1 Tax=Tigriopus californicus TaxID=6832 RepID=A0A553PHP1_TIGCA|nr:hypothetical protein TCAL_17011 [Tigriopus californicus]
MFKSIAIVLSACVVGYLAMPQQSPNDQSYLFADQAESLLYTPLSLSFSCEGQQYGYYADVDNGCQVFHICLPIEDDAGSVIETAQWSFICGNGTVFDQQTLTCNHEQDAFPCSEAASLYNTVSNMATMLMWTTAVRCSTFVAHEDDTGSVIETAQWSFICGNGTVFDQQTLTCNHEQDAFPCSEAASLYNTVEFGKIPDY